MAESEIANSYATALVEALKSPDDVQRVGADLETVSSLYREVPQLPAALDNPGYPAAKRLELLDGLLKKIRAHETTRRFLHLVLEKGRIRLLPAIVSRFGELRDERLGVAGAEVVTAVPLDAKTKAEMEKALGKVSGRKIRITYKTDGALLGGAITKVGSVVYDGSLRTQLSRIREVLSKE